MARRRGRRKLKQTKAAKAARRRYRLNKKRAKRSASWFARHSRRARTSKGGPTVETWLKRRRAARKKVAARRRHRGKRRGPQVSARWKALPKSERLRLGHAIVEQTFGAPLRGRGSATFHKGERVSMSGGARGVVEYTTPDGWVGVRENHAEGGSTIHEWQPHQVSR